MQRGVFSTYSHHRLAKKICTEAAKLQVDSIAIYEGTFTELELAIRMARLCPELTVQFNFYDGIEVSKFFSLCKTDELETLRSTLSAFPNLAISSETEPLNQLVKDKLQIESSVFPVFTTLDYQIEQFSGILPETKVSRSRVVVSIGKRDDLEFGIEVASWCKSQDLPVSLIIQPRIRVRAEELSNSNLSGIQVLSLLDPVAYSGLLQSAKVWVFTYAPEDYELKSSGRVQDCLLMGVIPLAPEGTALTSQWAEGEKFSYKSRDLSSAVTSLSKALAASKMQFGAAITREHYAKFLNEIVRSRPVNLGERSSIRVPKLRRIIRIRKKIRSRGMSLRHLMGRILIRMGLRPL